MESFFTCSQFLRPASGLKCCDMDLWVLSGKKDRLSLSACDYVDVHVTSGNVTCCVRKLMLSC